MKVFGTVLSALVGVLLACLPAKAQPNADQVLQLIVGYPAGGGLDSATRQLAERLREMFNMRVVVENRPGAASLIAAQMVANAKPDGNMLIMAPISVTAVHPFIFKDLRFDPNADLVPVAELGVYRYGLAVNANVPAKNVDEFIAWTKANPGKVNFATLGKGSFAQLLGVAFNAAAGTDMVEVPYKGSAPGLIDLRAGHVQSTFDTFSSLLEQHQSGAIRVLAVSGSERSPALPDVASFGETKLELGALKEAEFWYGLFAPKGTPKPVVDNLNKVIVAALASTELKDRLAPLGITPRPQSADDFAAIVKADTERWKSVIQKHAAKLEEKQ